MDNNIPITNSSGKISFDELSEEVLKILREGSSNIKIIDDKYKLIDSTGAFQVFELGTEFSLIELLVAVAEKSKIVDNIETYITETIESKYERKFALLERSMQLVQSDIEFLKKFGGGIDPGDADADYSINRNDYIINIYEDNLGIQVGEHEVKLPIDMFVNDRRLEVSSAKLKNLTDYINVNYSNLAKVEEMYNNIKSTILN